MLLEIGGAGNLVAQQLYYNGNMQLASGSYFFGERTQSFYVTNGFSINDLRYNASFSFPFVVQNSPWISYSGTGGIPTGGPQSESVGQHTRQGMGQGMGGRRQHIDLPDTASYNQSGFSDPSANMGYRIIGKDYGTTSVKLNASLKFPLADPTRGFGTGEWDVGWGGSVSQRINTWFISGNLMYWHYGDMPDLELKNALNYGAGIGKSLAGGKWMLLGSFFGMTEIIEDVDPPLSAGLGIGRQIGGRTNFNANIYFGLSESSSDVAVGAGWQVKLN